MVLNLLDDLLDDRPLRKRVSKQDREHFYKRQSGKCNYCGKKDVLAYFEIDHKNPVANNGANRTSNYQLLCGPCNKRKGDMTDGEFRRAYKLTPARQADGPPSKVIPQKYFEEISKTIAAKKAKRRQREKDDLSW